MPFRKTPEKWQQAFEILLGLRSVLVNLGETRRSSERLQEAGVFADKLNDDRRRAHVWALSAGDGALRGHLDGGIAAGWRALAISERVGDGALGLMARGSLCQAHYYRGDYSQVVELAVPALSAAAQMPVYHSASIPNSVFIRCWILRSLAELGEFAKWPPHAHKIIELAEMTRSHYPVGMAQVSAGWSLLAKGDWDRAWPHIEGGTLEYRKGDVFLSLPHGVASSARVLAQRGEACAALTCLEEGEELLGRGIQRGTVRPGRHGLWMARTCRLPARQAG
jgi:hypothetical protein